MRFSRTSGARPRAARGARPTGARLAGVLLASMVLAAAPGCRRAPARATPEASAAPSIPRDAARFEIDAVDDSTARFRPKEATWVTVGMTVYAVDPAQRDALVARMRIVRADSAGLRALVTAQVARVTTEHFVLAVRPKVPWYRAGRFWTGVLTGGAVGAGAAVIAR